VQACKTGGKATTVATAMVTAGSEHPPPGPQGVMADTTRTLRTNLAEGCTRTRAGITMLQGHLRADRVRWMPARPL